LYKIFINIRRYWGLSVFEFHNSLIECYSFFNVLKFFGTIMNALMNSLKNMSKKKAKNTIIYIIVGVSLFFIGHRFIFLFPRTMKHISSYIAYPALVFHCYAIDPVKIWFFQRKTMQKFTQKFEEVCKERDTLLAENITLRASSGYVQDIAELVTFKKQYEIPYARVAQILVRHLSDQSHFFLIDAGATQGIQVDMVAIYKNCLVGKVIEVYPWYSKIQLITDSRCKVAGYCTDTNVQGIYEGINHEHKTMLRYVSHLNHVKQDDMIMSSGEGLIFPRGFALGRVTDISPNGLCHIIMAKPLIDLRNIKYCLVIVKGMHKAINHDQK